MPGMVREQVDREHALLCITHEALKWPQPSRRAVEQSALDEVYERMQVSASWLAHACPASMTGGELPDFSKCNSMAPGQYMLAWPLHIFAFSGTAASLSSLHLCTVGAAGSFAKRILACDKPMGQ